ncbi:zf-HC2 domain-containing protein [Streptomyces niger]|uniref:zf-HC2 domain-containing protein n=1 Tax=Streptomyces niger TaxID=66373 RepID=UPI00069AC8DD|nr:zf-HC2 domain-containing protein [Streptomyces niger]
MNRPHPSAEPADHTDVGAYALGVLDAAHAARFEEHLAGCDRCAAELDGLLGLGPLLAGLADDGTGTPPSEATLVPTPSRRVLSGLLSEVAAVRRRGRRRRLALVAAAVALIVGGPLATLAVTGDAPQQPTRAVGPAEQMYDSGRDKHTAVDPVTKVAAGVAMADRPWGTSVALRLGNVKGPLTCSLIAIGKDGAEQTVTTWAVPYGGYGIKGGTTKWSRQPLYTNGGAAMSRAAIDRFEIRTLTGRRLAAVDV